MLLYFSFYQKPLQLFLNASPCVTVRVTTRINVHFFQFSMVLSYLQSVTTLYRQIYEIYKP